mmetsp:Transcript_65136/g.141999  ORF Transcript_65136/g.141999 Transcript_65136/m.141999 type:complete len:215 (-) Transcript_65136:56-700(-)
MTATQTPTFPTAFTTGKQRSASVKLGRSMSGSTWWAFSTTWAKSSASSTNPNGPSLGTSSPLAAALMKGWGKITSNKDLTRRRCVLSETFADNPDSKDPVLSTEYGIYAEGCGLDNVHLAWGHDEYMYQVLSRNGCSIPEEGLLMIRYHSLYPWHTGGAYSWMESPKDKEIKGWVQEFNKFDLYSKADALPNVEEIKPYYEKLVNKYCPGKLRW